MDVWEHWYSLKLYFELRCFLDGQITCILFHWLLFWWFEDYPRRPLKGNFRMAQKQNKQQSSKSGCLLLSDCSAADNADGVELLTMPAVTVHVSAWWLGNLTSQCPTTRTRTRTRIYLFFIFCLQIIQQMCEESRTRPPNVEREWWTLCSRQLAWNLTLCADSKFVDICPHSVSRHTWDKKFLERIGDNPNPVSPSISPHLR